MAYLGPLTYPGPGLYPVSADDGTTTGIYPPTLTGHVDAAPTPRVDVVFTSLDPSCATVTIWRQATGRQLPVRGGINLAVAGGAAIVDLEAPSGVPCLYLAQMFDTDGTFIGVTGTAQITLDSPDTWVQNPFDPAGAVKVKVDRSTGITVANGASLTAIYPAGRRAGIGVGGQRTGIPNVPVTVYSDTAAAAEDLDAMFGTVNGDLGLPPFLVVRFAAKIAKQIRLPQPLVLGVSGATRTLINADRGEATVGWDISGPELDPPAAGLAQAVYSRDDMDIAFPSRDARDKAYTTRMAMDTDYNHSGAATGGSPDAGIPGDTGTDVPAGVWGDGIYGDGVYGATTDS